MKKAVSLIILLGCLWIVSACRSPEESASIDPEKERVREFWQLYKEATDLRIRKEFLKAIQSYDAALKLNPKHEESLYYLGNCYYEIGRQAKAVQAYERILTLNSQSNRALSQLGILLSTPEPGAVLDLERAEEMFQRVRAINPEESGPFIRSGLVAAQKQDWSRSYKEFTTAAGFRSPEAIFLAGAVQFMQGKYAEAEGLFIKVLEINAKERQISGRGVASEGDVRSDSESALNLMEKAGVKSLMWLNWAAAVRGKRPAEVPAHFQIPQRGSDYRSMLSSLKGRTEWSDWDDDGDADPVSVADRKVRVFRNDRGKMKDITGATGITDPASLVLWIDFNNDGHVDLYALSSGFYGTGENRLYRNEGGGKFADVTVQVGLSGDRSTTDALSVDVDLDGDPDLIEGGNGSHTESSLRLYRNNNGTFSREDLPARPGVVVDLISGDYNLDQLPDVLVTVWKGSPILYENQGDGKFADRTSSAGLNNVSGQSYGALFWHFDQDEFPDLLMTQWAPYAISLLRFVRPEAKILEGTPRLFQNTQKGAFREVTTAAGLTHAFGTMSVAAADLNGDSSVDVVLGNGGLDVMRLEPSVILWNRGGQRLEEEPIPGSHRPLNTHYVSIADADADGAPEIYLSTGHMLRK